jgi:hypothetical protein
MPQVRVGLGLKEAGQLVRSMRRRFMEGGCRQVVMRLTLVTVSRDLPMVSLCIQLTTKLSMRSGKVVVDMGEVCIGTEARVAACTARRGSMATRSLGGCR